MPRPSVQRYGLRACQFRKRGSRARPPRQMKTKPAVELAREIHKPAVGQKRKSFASGCLCGAHSVPIENWAEGRS